jgi:hypothetical protein
MDILKLSPHHSPPLKNIGFDSNSHSSVGALSLTPRFSEVAQRTEANSTVSTVYFPIISITPSHHIHTLTLQRFNAFRL